MGSGHREREKVFLIRISSFSKIGTARKRKKSLLIVGPRINIVTGQKRIVLIKGFNVSQFGIDERSLCLRINLLNGGRLLGFVSFVEGSIFEPGNFACDAYSSCSNAFFAEDSMELMSTQLSTFLMKSRDTNYVCSSYLLLHHKNT